MGEDGLQLPREKGRIRKFLGILSPIGVFFLLALWIGIIMVIFKALFNLIISGQSVTLHENNMISAIYSYINNKNTGSNLMLFLWQIISIIIFLQWYKKNNDISKEIRKEIFSVRSLGLLTLNGFAENLTIRGVFILVTPIIEKEMRDYSEHINRGFDRNQIICYISAIILAPILEELMIRGLIMKKAEKLFTFTIANIIQALIFGILHLNIVQITYAFFGGLILGYVAHKYQSILASIILHAISNLFGTLLLIGDSVYIAPLYIVVGGGLLLYTLKQISRVRIPKELTQEIEV
jgi:membrane protease YdiL (CAAX protease family)